MPHIFVTGGSRQSISADAVVLQKPFGKASLLAAIECGARRLAEPA